MPIPSIFGSAPNSSKHGAGSRYGTAESSPAGSPRSVSPAPPGAVTGVPPPAAAMSPAPPAGEERYDAARNHRGAGNPSSFKDLPDSDYRLTSGPPASPSLQTLRGNSNARQTPTQPRAHSSNAEPKPEFLTGIIGMMNEMQVTAPSPCRRRKPFPPPSFQTGHFAQAWHLLF